MSHVTRGWKQEPAGPRRALDTGATWKVATPRYQKETSTLATEGESTEGNNKWLEVKPDEVASALFQLASEAKVKLEDKKSSSLTSGLNVNSGPKQDLPVLRVDDKQRLAKERREERQKQLAAREQLLFEKEEKARQHYEKQLEERKKKIEEQRLKEERRRTAVEEKRKQRLQEERERHEAVVRRTIERSQRIKHKSTRWSWGGALQNNANINRDDVDRRSVSTMNLAKHVDPVISKRLSSSSVTLLNSPDKARRLQLSPWESNMVTRLLTPTHSFLARSRSIAALNGSGLDAVSASSITPPICKNLHNSMSDWPRTIVTTHDVRRRSRSAHPTRMDKREKERENEREKNAVVTHATNATAKRSYSPLNAKYKLPVPSIIRLSPKNTSVVNPKLIISPSGSVKNSSIQGPPSPGNVHPMMGFKCEIQDQEVVSPKPQEDAESVPIMLSATPGKVTAGTTDAAEATRLLTEKRRIAREQRDREEEEKREQEERERQIKEEMMRRKSEEKARREEEARRFEEEKMLQEQQQKLEEERRLLEEKAQKDKDEQERLQKQKEEDARAREEAEKLRKEREEHFQKQEQERMERKKRLEQIMTRTRKSNTPEKKNNQLSSMEERNAQVHDLASPDEATGQNFEHITETKAVAVIPEEVTNKQSVIPDMDNDGGLANHSLIDKECPSAQTTIRENGVSLQDESFEDYIDISFGIKSTRVATETTDCQDEDRIPVNPVIAFEENRSMELLTKVDGIQTQQTAEVI
ncbi:ensconsin isoform X2 [Narcine bancroftii]|uniref:ensconsin isoform X2 n=1 Tax=Narcine bancroftii TaxID=1343680 RepID=UPI003831323F